MGTIQIDGLTRDYGQGRGVFDLSFSVAEGEVFGFLGPNGAGKTTTIRHIMGFLRPRRGQCRVSGLDAWADRARIQRSLGYVPGEMAFPDDMTGEGFLRFCAEYRGLRDRSRATQLLQRFDLDPRIKLGKMSKGMRQKVGIVAALQHDPRVLVLDEPTSGLDPLMQNLFIQLVQEEQARGKTILMSSHMFEEVERTCERVGIIRRGRLVAVDSVDALKAKQMRKYIITLDSPLSAAAFADICPNAEGVDDTRVTVRLQGDITPLIRAMHASPVVNIAAPSQGLDEIFLHYYGGDSQ